MTSFADLGLPNKLVDALKRRNIEEPFPVQEASIPDALAGRDVCGKAPTGSGKTLAFGLPTLVRVEKASHFKPRALILAPTRELAEQIKQELVPLAKPMGRFVHAVYGGVSYGPQKQALKRGVDVLVATPGRLIDLIEQRAVNLVDVDIVVVDEADRMADMGFLPVVKQLLNMTSKDRQTILFSATLDNDIAVLRRDYQNDPVTHEAGSTEPETIDARHHFWKVQQSDRVNLTAAVVDEAGKSIVFTRTRRGADRLAKQLAQQGVKAVAMHGGRSQGQRTRALKEFSTGRASALIATDVAARGIHIDAVASVIHFDPPADFKDYLHRSGRTARAGATGTVVSLVMGDQIKPVRRLQHDLDLKVPIGDADVSGMLESGYRIGDRVSGSNGSSDKKASERNRPERRPVNAGRSHERGDRDRTRDKAEVPSRRPSTRGAHPKHHAKPRGGESLYVGNLPWDATADDIRQLFNGHGQVKQATVIMNKKTGRSKGFAFVDMPEAEHESVIAALNGSPWEGRDLQVRPARPRHNEN